MKPLFYVLCLFVACQVVSAQTMFKIVPGRSENRAQFKSDATMETVVGTTHTITGFVELDPASDGSGARGEVHVDLVSLKSGMELRDRHMRENQLETDKYPEAVFTLTSLMLPTGGLTEGQRVAVTIHGKLLLHGVEQEIEPTTYLTLEQSASGSALHVESNFIVRLQDYQILRPQFLMMRLAEEQEISINLMATSISKSS